MTAKLWFGLGTLVAGFVGIGLWLWTPGRSRSALEQKYLARDTDMVEIAGTRLHVRDTGEQQAEAVVLVHGLGSSLHTWDDWSQALEQHFRVIRLDLPGSGLSPPDRNTDYSDTRSIELLLALMDQRGIERASFVGNSIGGRIAWSLAAAHPERVSKLVLVAPDGFESPGYEYGKPAKVPTLLQAMRYVLPKSMLRSNIAIAYADPTALSDATLDRYYELMLGPGTRTALLARMEQTVLSNPQPLLERITSPVLLLWGEADAMIPIANAADYQAALPQSELVRLPGLGHVPQEEAPDRSVAPVLAFLTG